METMRWAAEAEQRLRKVPFFIRPWVKRRAEAVARERGLSEVTGPLLDEIKNREHRPA
jgi:light-independent protochlorophyllide reductase subunit B